MVIKLLLALFIPCLLVILFTRVTYNHYVGTGLAIALLGVSVVKGHTDTVLIGIVDVISLVAGFLYSRNMVNRVKR